MKNILRKSGLMALVGMMAMPLSFIALPSLALADAVGTCPVDTVQNFVETVLVDSTSSTATAGINNLANAQTYLFVASGTWANRNDSNQIADAEYATLDAWSTYEDGYNHGDYQLGEGEFDLQVDGAFINWGSYNPSHEYSYLYTGNGSPANFLIFDGDSTVQNPTPNAGWYGDNSGSLTVNIYSCDPIVVTPPPTKDCKDEDKDHNEHEGGHHHKDKHDNGHHYGNNKPDNHENRGKKH